MPNSLMANSPPCGVWAFQPCQDLPRVWAALGHRGQAAGCPCQPCASEGRMDSPAQPGTHGLSCPTELLGMQPCTSVFDSPCVSQASLSLSHVQTQPASLSVHCLAWGAFLGCSPPAPGDRHRTEATHTSGFVPQPCCTMESP